MVTIKTILRGLAALTVVGSVPAMISCGDEAYVEEDPCPASWNGTVKTLSANTFDKEVLNASSLVVLQLWSPQGEGCAPSKRFFEELATRQDYCNVSFVRYDITKDWGVNLKKGFNEFEKTIYGKYGGDLMPGYGTYAIPSFTLFDHGKKKFFCGKYDLEAKLKHFLGN